MNNKTLGQLWDDAANFDSTLAAELRHYNRLRRKEVRSEPFDRDVCFLKMARRQPAVYRGLAVPVELSRSSSVEDALLHAYRTMFPKGERSRVQVGPSAREMRLPVEVIVERWLGRRAVVGVTDLHIRGTKVEDVIDTDPLTDFNLLVRGSEELSVQEMMTLVVASRGNVTDSHSDDPDGTNHCFVGAKLWLAWDTFEGMAAGLEDVERQDVLETAGFEMDTFCGLKSSRWFVVANGDTLFLPGNMTHKVVTLEPYLGIGSFHVGLPGLLDCASRWLLHGPLWSIGDDAGETCGLVDEVLRVGSRIARRTHRSSDRYRHRWGVNHLGAAAQSWTRRTPAASRRVVLENDRMREFFSIAAGAA